MPSVPQTIPDAPSDIPTAVSALAEGKAGLGQVSEEVGAEDVFVFRRVERDRFLHVGGTGRGEGWAGIVELRLSEDRLPAAACKNGAPLRVIQSVPGRIFGPYYALCATIVPVTHDLMVIFGSPRGPLADLDDSALCELALRASENANVVSPTKRLADELELLHAIRELMSFDGATLDAAADHVVAVAARALSCELGVLYMRGEDRVAVWREGDMSQAERDAYRATLHFLDSTKTELPWCEQEASQNPLPAPFSTAEGITSYYLLAVPCQSRSLLLLLHTETAPRGFTNLCREIGVGLTEAAASVLRMATSRHELQAKIDRTQEEANRDSLTGLANRRAWESALSTGGRDRAASIVVADLDNLKRVNDTLGHQAGDELLKRAAEALQLCARDGDFVARIGGDEFAALLRDTTEDGCESFTSRLLKRVGELPSVDGWPVSLAVGWATAGGGVTVEEAQCRADAVMYESKRGRVARSPAA
ncbi:hypothetical protein BH18ACT15_BH18ACT15_02570 [soil metagenome]